MKVASHHDLSNDLIKEITEQFPSKTYKTHSVLFYEGQIPISGYLIIDGAIQITSKKKFKKVLSSGTLIGIMELIHKKPSQMSAEIFPNTIVCFLDISTVQEVCTKFDTNLSIFFKNLIGES